MCDLAVKDEKNEPDNTCFALNELGSITPPACNESTTYAYTASQSDTGSGP